MRTEEYRDRAYDLIRHVKQFENNLPGDASHQIGIEKEAPNFSRDKICMSRLNTVSEKILDHLIYLTDNGEIVWKINQKSASVSFDCVVNSSNYSARDYGLFANDISLQLGSNKKYTAFYEDLMANYLECGALKEIESIVDSLITKYKNFQN